MKYKLTCINILVAISVLATIFHLLILVSVIPFEITWVEIYVEDMSRAQKFYETVLQIEMIPMQAPGEFGDLEMLSFPWAQKENNISGALCKTSEMKSGAGGTLVYFTCEDCAVETARVEKAGGKVLQDKFPIGEHGFCSVTMDTEGNTIGFHSDK